MRSVGHVEKILEVWRLLPHLFFLFCKELLLSTTYCGKVVDFFVDLVVLLLCPGVPHGAILFPERRNFFQMVHYSEAVARYVDEFANSDSASEKEVCPGMVDVVDFSRSELILPPIQQVWVVFTLAIHFAFYFLMISCIECALINYGLSIFEGLISECFSPNVETQSNCRSVELVMSNLCKSSTGPRHTANRRLIYVIAKVCSDA